MMKILLNDDIEHFDFEAALPLLSEQRREQALKFKHDLGRKTCAAAYLLLCEALRSEYGITELPIFQYGEHGKPVIAGRPDIHFNLSHCREAAICAVSDRPIGVDVESIREFHDSLVRYTMNDREVEQILQAERIDVAFIRLWTMKEAVLKLSGRGIVDDMKHVLDNVSHLDLTTVTSPDVRFVYTVASCQRTDESGTSDHGR